MPWPQLWLVGQAASSASEAGAVTIIALIAAFGGLVSGVGGVVLQRRRDSGVARKDYVEGSLAALQANIDQQATEDTRLRALNEQRLKRIDALEDELAEVHAELARCRKKCDDCLKRVGRLERNRADE